MASCDIIGLPHVQTSGRGCVLGADNNYNQVVGQSAPSLWWTSRPAVRVATSASHNRGRFVMDKIKCACGCGQLRDAFDKRGRPRKYLKGHHARKPDVIIECAQCGKEKRKYPSDLKHSKSGLMFCSPECKAKGIAHLVSAALGGEGAIKPEDYPKGKQKRDADYYKRNVDHVRSGALSYYQRNRERILKQRRAKDRALKKEIIDAYGGICECCGESMIEFLTIDHINNDGAKHRAKVGSGRRMYQDIKDQGFPEDIFQVLCFNCNITRGFYGYCPHQPEDVREVDKTPGTRGGNIGRPRTVD